MREISSTPLISFTRHVPGNCSLCLTVSELARTDRLLLYVSSYQQVPARRAGTGHRGLETTDHVCGIPILRHRYFDYLSNGIGPVSIG